MRIYVASSWKNPLYPSVLHDLRASGHLAYDFRDENAAFNWSEVDATWDAADPVLSARDLQRALAAVPAEKAYANDKRGLDWCDAGVLVMPCGRSAHLEAGYLIGQGKPVFVLLAGGERPDLMHKLATKACASLAEVFEAMADHAFEVAA